MCGICGIADHALPLEELKQRTQSAIAEMEHRGPDGSGLYAESEGLVLGHVRLSILDLRQAAGQPMQSADGDWVLTYNGEIYNFLSLRRELESAGAQFRTNSDTEVLLEGLARWGVASTLERLQGMFAFAAWNRRNRKLYLARDRVGQKPLFYGICGQSFIFGSELRVARHLAPQACSVSPGSCAMMVRYKTIPAPFTVYKDIWKLRPGHWVEYDFESHQVGRPRPYWSPAAAAIVPTREALWEMFVDSVEKRMISDVPLGAFLSGGIDSSLVVATMQMLSSNPVKTFTIGFDQKEFDEAEHAAEVARHLGTEHTELRVSAADLLDVVPELHRLYDEPFGDSSQIPTILVSRLARRHVTVALSGDGGDEGFGGYNRHIWLPRLEALLRLCPLPLRRVLANLLGVRLVEDSLDRLSQAGLLPVRMVRNKLDKLRQLLQCEDFQALYRQAVSDLDSSADLFDPGIRDQITESQALHVADPFLRVCLTDIGFYLPEDILVKVDRASMSCSLEARSPFLDHRLMEMALAAPKEWKVGRGGGKLILREWLGQRVPREFFERPKMGFAVPLAEWLRGELRDWGDTLLREGKWRAQGFIRPEAVLALWDEHQSGRKRHHHLLWNLLMLAAWLEESG
jgi:asparagine synthase (glutamine-hydrolysing)